MTVPTDLSGLRLWYKADAIGSLANNDPVTTWIDSSGQGFDAGQATGGSKPLYKTNIQNGLPVVRFDGVDDFFTNVTWSGIVDSTGGGIYTILGMINVASSATGAAATYDDACILTDAGGNTGYAHTRDATGSLTVRAYNWDGNEDFASVTGVGYSAWRKITQDHDNTTLRIKSQGGAFATAASGAPSASGSMLFGSNYAGAKFFAGDIAEIVLYDRVLTDPERDSIELYLFNKWTPGGVTKRMFASLGVGR